MTSTTSHQEASDLPKIGAPATRALAAQGYTHLNQLTGVSENELASWHGVGPKAIGILRDALTARGLAFADGQATE